MTADERDETEARADRSKRRGELAQALAGYNAILAAFPGDEAVQRKLAELQDSVDPAELRHPKANFADAAPGGPAQTAEQEGERLFAAGDYPGAIGALRRALAERPDNELVKERLGEIFRLVQGPARAAPSAVQEVQAAPPPRSPPAAARAMAVASVDPAELYRALLERISARRRV
jgi:tetratricopeptide (TPR) repeat protein